MKMVLLVFGFAVLSIAATLGGYVLLRGQESRRMTQPHQDDRQ